MPLQQETLSQPQQGIRHLASQRLVNGLQAPTVIDPHGFNAMELFIAQPRLQMGLWMLDQVIEQELDRGARRAIEEQADVAKPFTTGKGGKRGLPGTNCDFPRSLSEINRF